MAAEKEKPRCKWRGKRIAWCRKRGKFCDAPKEYYTCTDYEPTKSDVIEKVQHNVDVLRRQIFRVETQGSLSSPLDLKTQFGAEFRNMIFEGEREGKEVGAMICQSPSGELHLSRVCWGAKGKVHVIDCHDHLKPYGSFHVHLHGSDVFSPQDLEQAIDREQLSCIGYVKGGISTLKCVTPRKYYEHTQDVKAKIRMDLKETAKNIELKRAPEEVRRRLYDIEQLLGAYEIQL